LLSRTRLLERDNMSVLFEKFWAAYPKRNGKKVGRYTCSLWFEAKKPDEKLVDKMVMWLEIDKHNRAICEIKKEFYNPLPDPIRFLKNQLWMDEVDRINDKVDDIKTKARERSDAINQANVLKYKAGYESLLDEQNSVDTIKGNKVFMGLCRQYSELKEWALLLRPDLSTKQRTPTKEEIRQAKNRGEVQSKVAKLTTGFLFKD